MRLDLRSNREILLSVERHLCTLIESTLTMDLYDRIIAGVAALQAGDTTALQQHVAAIDNHLSQVDADTLQLEGDDTASKSRLDAIEAGLGKIADAVSPPPVSSSVSTTVSTSDSAPVSASVSDSTSSAVSTSDSVSSVESAPTDGSTQADVQP